MASNCFALPSSTGSAGTRERQRCERESSSISCPFSAKRVHFSQHSADLKTLRSDTLTNAGYRTRRSTQYGTTREREGASKELRGDTSILVEIKCVLAHFIRQCFQNPQIALSRVTGLALISQHSTRRNTRATEVRASKFRDNTFIFNEHRLLNRVGSVLKIPQRDILTNA